MELNLSIFCFTNMPALRILILSSVHAFREAEETVKRFRIFKIKFKNQYFSSILK